MGLVWEHIIPTCTVESARNESSVDSRSSGSTRIFAFRDLAIATEDFKVDNLIGEGGFGKVFKGRFASGQASWITVTFQCGGASKGPWPNNSPLDWNTRMKIALGVAKGLAYLHDVANPPVIYRDMKVANILLDDDFNPKLSDFGLAKLGPVGDKTHVSTRVMGTYGYCAPDYAMSGKLTVKSDIYSFGVLLLELITGRRVLDTSRARREQNLTTWARPFLIDQRKYSQLADPALQGRYPSRSFHQLVVISSICLQEQAQVRPIIADVVVALDHVASQLYTAEPPPSFPSSQGADTERFCLIMGNCFGTPVEDSNPSDTRTSSAGGSTSRTGDNSTSISSKLSTINSSTLGQSVGSCANTDDVFLEGQILEVPNLRIFTFAELRSATRNFKPDTVLGEGGFGKVYKGWVDEKTLNPTRSGIGMIVAVKKLNPESVQGLEEWQSEVNFLGRLSHPNLVKLLGYCWEDRELLLVYEYMARGSLENHLFRKGSSFEPFPWELRMKIAIGAARGLAFLHASEKQVIYRDFKASNILLDSNYNAKLSDFGLAKNGPTGEKSHVTTRIMGTYGYAAPEYVATGHLYVKSDVYGFGVLLLEMLSGMRALDTSRPSGQHNFVDFAKPYLADRRKMSRLMDPRLEGYPPKAAQHAAQLTLRCLSGDPKSRPSMKEVVEILEKIDAVKSRPRESKSRSSLGDLNPSYEENGHGAQASNHASGR
ncbi:hypothetical protein Cni_G25618 [Canna indica]|uniref:non-specific serine/threonine protein kinase n=1 Tax=Canna indica TaxID=4628 RepID=A0AAQ3QQL4_9LILI|nr:hypothetical protein Cni_G25618 [Canna indica]